MPAGAVVNLRTNSSSIRKHSTRRGGAGCSSPAGPRGAAPSAWRRSASSGAGTPRARPCAGSTDFEVGQDDLERPLEDLGLAPDVQEIARLEQSGQALRSRSRAVRRRVPVLSRSSRLQIKVPLPIGPELLVGDQKGLVDRVAIDELIDVAAGHAGNRFAQARCTCLEPGTASGAGDRFYERSGAGVK